MAKQTLFLFLLFSIIYASFAQDISPKLSELKGFEDSQGNTHLLYRIYTHDEDSISTIIKKHIYHLVPGSSVDELFLTDSIHCHFYLGGRRNVYDIAFWDNDITRYIHCGVQGSCIEGHPYISRYDTQNVNSGLGSFEYIGISGQNDSVVYCGGYPISKSTDGGFTWYSLYFPLQFLSVSPYNDQLIFAKDDEGKLYRSTNGGADFFIVDSLTGPWYINFYYDPDGVHIYRTDNFGFVMKRSSVYGAAFTWENIYSSEYLHVTVDLSVSGDLYLSDRRNIFHSTDYGTTFQQVKKVEYNINGIYKKPASDKIYIADNNRICEISGDSLIVLKSLPVLPLYPLSVGNKWIYKFNRRVYPEESNDVFSREVLPEEIKPNGKKYFRIEEKYSGSQILNTAFERIDLLIGKIYRYDESCPYSEQLIDDLLMTDLWDTSYFSRFGYCSEQSGTIFSSTGTINMWGINGILHSYNSIGSTVGSFYSLMTDIGLTYFQLTNGNIRDTYELKGMVKNGIVYGDTTMSDIKETSTQVPHEYLLEQNYPNPFNPVTKIRWQSPHPGLQQIKIYDLLGNEIAELINEYKPAGTYEAEFDASKLPSGVYFYSLKSGSYSATKKMTVIK